MSKYFIITVDTEEDNQWDSNHEASTENVKFLPRFQELAEKYGFKPVWLSTYEMVNNKDFVKYFKIKQDAGLCEIGMHLHAWNNPPYYDLEKLTNFRSYITEYPKEIMNEKVENITKLITKKFGKQPVSHRSGRWALNDDYLDVLSTNGYKVDCSVTPGVDWSSNLGITGQKGNDYTNYPKKIYKIKNNLYEYPVTIKKIHVFNYKKIHNIRNFLHQLKNLLCGSIEWIRPNKSNNLLEMKKIVNKRSKKGEYIMFMIHSSELMPGGSPNFLNDTSIEELYSNIENFFAFVKNKGFKGITLSDYYINFKKGTYEQR